MTERVHKLREQSINIKPVISTERAELLTDLYQNGHLGTVSTPVARALTFKHIMENKSIHTKIIEKNQER